MKIVYPEYKKYVLNENSIKGKPIINRESKSDELTILLYSCYDINMNLLAVVTPLSIYHYSLQRGQATNMRVKHL